MTEGPRTGDGARWWTRADLAWLLRPHRGRLAVIAAAVLVAAALELVPPLVLRHLIDDKLVGGDAEGVAGTALVFLAATAVRSALGLVYGYQAVAAAQAMLHSLRVRLFSHVCSLPVEHHDQNPVGDTISRCTADLDTVQELMSRGFVTVAAEVVPLAAVIAAMVVLSPPLTVLSALAIPPIVVIGRFIRVRVRAAQRANRASIGRLAAHVNEDLTGVDVIRSFRKDDFFVARFRRALGQSLTTFNRANLANTFYAPTIGLVAGAMIALLLWTGTTGLAGGFGTSVGTLAAFVLLFQRFVQPVTVLSEEWQRAQAAVAGAERVFEVLAASPRRPATSSAGPARGATPDPTAPPLVVSALSFGYWAERPVLRDVDIHADPGEWVAVVGPSGAGKSTLLELVVGLRQPWSGTVRVGGADPTELDDEDRRPLVGFVPQQAHVFNASLADNITLADPRVDRATLDRVIAVVGLDTLMKPWPAGAQTRLAGGGRGDGFVLSAAQRQLLALARVLVFDPVLVLLDEATAYVDPLTDAGIRHMLRREVCGRGGALVTVSHRPSTARAADRVVVVEGGQTRGARS